MKGVRVVRYQSTGLAWLESDKGRQQVIGAVTLERAQEIADFLGLKFEHVVVAI